MAINNKVQNKTVAILMATYNGGKHIENQILSLQQQTYKNWELYIQDDGSSDDTLNIIRKLKSYDERINIVDNNKKKQGAGRNFLSLVKNVHTDYAIFCDQDDIWLENKLSSMVQYAEEKELANSSQPSIVYADGYAYYDNTGEIDFSGISHNHADSLGDYLFFNGGYQGCSILFNRAMVSFIKNYNGYIHLHDDIVSLAAHALGNVYFLPKKLMLYRQHAAAVTGAKSFNNSLVSKLFSNVNYLLSMKHYRVKESFYKNYGALLSQDNKKIFEYYIKFCSSSNTLREFKYLYLGGFRINKSKLKLFCKFILRRKFDV